VTKAGKPRRVSMPAKSNSPKGVRIFDSRKSRMRALGLLWAASLFLFGAGARGPVAPSLDGARSARRTSAQLLAVPSVSGSRRGVRSSQPGRLQLRGGATGSADMTTERAAGRRDALPCPPSPDKAVARLDNAGVGAALSVNNDGRVVFAQLVPSMPAANSGAISIGDILVYACTESMLGCSDTREFVRCLPSTLP